MTAIRNEIGFLNHKAEKLVEALNLLKEAYCPLRPLANDSIQEAAVALDRAITEILNKAKAKALNLDNLEGWAPKIISLKARTTIRLVGIDLQHPLELVRGQILHNVHDNGSSWWFENGVSKYLIERPRDGYSSGLWEVLP
jgi:hypothetical protein